MQLDHVAIEVPGNVGLYDIQTELPRLTDPSSRGLEALADMGPEAVDAMLAEVWRSCRIPAELHHKQSAVNSNAALGWQGSYDGLHHTRPCQVGCYIDQQSWSGSS